jgi:hypothetical protein
MNNAHVSFVIDPFSSEYKSNQSLNIYLAFSVSLPSAVVNGAFGTSSSMLILYAVMYSPL